jgi:2-oxoglutarate dehydrogenase E1 component
MGGWQDFQGVNAGYVAELYERYRRDPGSVDPASRALFDGWSPSESAVAAPSPGVGSPPTAAEVPAAIRVVVGAVGLADSIRKFGHLAAQLDPLGTPPMGDPTLDPSAHGISERDLEQLPAALVGGPVAQGAANAREAIDRLRRVYCANTGYDYAAIFVPEEREWLRHAAEFGSFRPPHDPIDPFQLLERITQVEVFERFLHRTFPGKTRFSVEGLDMLVPILDEVIVDASSAGTHHVLIGMAHRGRLNVLAHVLQKPYAQILAEFKDPVRKRTAYRIDLGWAGDVKYHSGARTRMRGQAPHDLIVSMAPNPSHLEAVNPVVAGMARAAGTRAGHAGAPEFDASLTLPILIHGDAAFPGQGVVAETLNLSRLEGYTNGGTIHIIVNNQLGFTATPEESYSTSYASGLARGFKIPIVHVNADDVEACVEVGRLAWAYRDRFKRDFLIDLVGYRRHGHNEGDEPAFTQPLLYKVVAQHPTVRERWAATLQERGLIDARAPEELVQKRLKILEDTLASLRPDEDLVETKAEAAAPGAAQQMTTGVAFDRLRALNDALLERPVGFVTHRKLERGRERRRAAFAQADERTVDWATAEELAFASLLEDGVPIRLTGEDVERGTFSHRHAVFHDAETGRHYTPLQAIPRARAAFEVHNSPLSELAAVGFEFGYNVQEPGRLVVWEAQYGDFINGAQIMLDQFVTSARAKWGQTPSLVFLLPHGYEGQGPEHSSARPERILQGAADANLRLANCTTAAQYFHLLRRQGLLLGVDPLPLFVMSPKSLLRHPSTLSAPRELAEGRFLPVIDDELARRGPTGVERLVLCSGKVYADLVAGEQHRAHREVALVRVEQLYPFPEAELRSVLGTYPKLRDVVWLQEEPANMGAWEFVRPLIETLLASRCPLRYIGRPRSASPSEGSAAWHAVNQRAIVDLAYDLRGELSPEVVTHERARAGETTRLIG